jgi:hypothetical protein
MTNNNGNRIVRNRNHLSRTFINAAKIYSLGGRLLTNRKKTLSNPAVSKKPYELRILGDEL